MRLIALSLLFILSSFVLTEDLNKEGQELVNTCTNALMQAIPPMWCWKKGGDFGLVPTGCPSGYFRSGALCYQNCSSGYRFIAGLCYKNCESGYKDHGLSCFVNLFKWHFKKSYLPKTLTNFSPQVPCPGDTYRAGALCYRNCNLIGMENCGIGACASDKSTCVTTIINMVKDVLQGIIDFVSFCVSVGTSSGVVAARNAVKTGMNKAGSTVIKAAFTSIKKIFVSKFKSVIKSKAKQIAKNLFKALTGANKGANSDEVCTAVFNSIETKIASSSKIPSVSSLVDAVDVFDIRGTVKSCSSKKAVECAQGVLNTLKTFDPTGLLTIATTFVKPTCDVPKTASLDTADVIDKVPRGCIQFFDDVNYKGEMFELCGEEEHFWEYAQHVKSIRASSIATYLFFANEDFTGGHFVLGRGAHVSNINDLIKGEGEDLIPIQNYMNSVMRVNEECVNMFYTDKEGIEKRIEFCDDANVNIDLAEIRNVSFEIYSDDVTVVLFEESNYSGKSVDFHSSLQEIDETFAIKSIGSIKLHVDYDALGFLCGHEAGTSEVIRANGEDVECLSFDGKNCIKLQMTQRDCAKYVNENSQRINPIKCGLPYQAVFGTTGYENENHWCSKGLKYFSQPLMFIE